MFKDTHLSISYPNLDFPTICQKATIKETEQLKQIGQTVKNTR